VVPSLNTRTALTTAYAAGLRASETVGLMVADIVSERGVIGSSMARAGRTLRHPVGAASGHSSHLLAAGQAEGVAISRSSRNRADRRAGSLFGLPLRRRYRQARYGPYAYRQVHDCRLGRVERRTMSAIELCRG